MKKYHRPALTVDGVIIYRNKLVLIRRKNEPFKNMLALPGGFVNYGEKVEDAIVREVKEETGLLTAVKKLVGVYSDPTRDPRGHTVSIVYLMEVAGGDLKAATDAKSVELVELNRIPALAFDHNKIVAEFLKRSTAPL